MNISTKFLVHFIFIFSIGFAIDGFAVSPANTLIENQVSVSYEIGEELLTTDSNTVSFRVLEVLDHTLVTNHPSGVPGKSPDTDKVLSFTLTNTGNGTDAYSLTTQQLTTDEFDAINLKTYIDQDGDGVFDSAADTLYVPGTNDPSLAMGDSVDLFIVSDLPGSLNQSDKAQIILEATSLEGTGALGELVAGITGVGDGGVDAVFGAADGDAEDQSFYIVESFLVEVIKSQSIVDPTGGSQSTKDSIITYTLDAEFTGAGEASNSILEDIIPAGTVYVPGTIKLDGVVQTDISDTDKSHFDGSKIIINLGNVTAPSSHKVEFQVKVQ